MRLALALAPGLLFAQPPDAKDLVRESAGAIKQFKSYQLETAITVEMHGGAIESNMDVPSSVAVRRPDKMRVESKSQAGSVTITSDGEHTWILLEPLNQYIQRDAAGSPEEASAKTSFLPRNLPDVSKSVKSVKLKGEEQIKIGAGRIPCWVVETVYDTIQLGDMTIGDGAQTTWISKAHKLNLETRFHANLHLSGIETPVEMTQVTRTTLLRLNPDLPDSLFAFTPPEGAKETADWTLPGIVKPDVIGKPAPAFKVKSIAGADIDLASLRGKVVLLNFWTTWCGPCKRELPVLEKLNSEFHDRGLVVVGVNVGDEKSAVEKFLDSFRLTFLVAPAEGLDDLVAELSINAFPTMLLIDRDGKVAAYEVGARGEAGLRKDLAKMGLGDKQ